MALRLQVEYFYWIIVCQQKWMIVKHASYCMIVHSCKHRVQNVFLRNKTVSNIGGLALQWKRKTALLSKIIKSWWMKTLKSKENYYITKMLNFYWKKKITLLNASLLLSVLISLSLHLPIGCIFYLIWNWYDTAGPLKEACFGPGGLLYSASWPTVIIPQFINKALYYSIQWSSSQSSLVNKSFKGKWVYLNGGNWQPDWIKLVHKRMNNKIKGNVHLTVTQVIPNFWFEIWPDLKHVGNCLFLRLTPLDASTSSVSSSLCSVCISKGFPSWRYCWNRDSSSWARPVEDTACLLGETDGERHWPINLNSCI